MILEAHDFSSTINESPQFHTDPVDFMDIKFDEISSSRAPLRKIDTCNIAIYRRSNSQFSHFGNLKLPSCSRTKKLINRQKSSPTPIIQQLLSVSDSEFMTMCDDPEVRFNPKALGFIPYSYWNDEEITFGDLVRNYFRKRNDPNCHFYQKLYNALLISTDDPFYAEFLGVEWITDRVLKIDKNVFSRLFGLKHPDSSLFHRHSFFSTNGFVELSSSDAAALVPQSDLSEIDFDHVRLLIHKDNVFTKLCSYDALRQYTCKRSQIQ